MFGMLTDNLRPDKWSITADREDVYKMGADYRAKIGYMKMQQNYVDKSIRHMYNKSVCESTHRRRLVFSTQHIA